MIDGCTCWCLADHSGLLRQSTQYLFALSCAVIKVSEWTRWKISHIFLHVLISACLFVVIRRKTVFQKLPMSNLCLKPFQTTATMRTCVETWSTSCSSFLHSTTACYVFCVVSWPAWPHFSKRAGTSGHWLLSLAQTSFSKIPFLLKRARVLLPIIVSCTSVSYSIQPSLFYMQFVNRRRRLDRPGDRQQDPGRAVGQPGRTFWLGGRWHLLHQWLQLH